MFSLFIKPLEVDAIGDGTELAYLGVDVPVDTEEDKPKPEKDDAGGGGGSGNHEKDPPSQRRSCRSDARTRFVHPM